MFLVTPEGIIMSDPINRDFARYLKAELASRFKVPVRYVLYTHSDWDHASGGVVFADTAEFVGQQNMLVSLAPPVANPPLDAAGMKMDANRKASSIERGGRRRGDVSRSSITTVTTCRGAELAPAR